MLLPQLLKQEGLVMIMLMLAPDYSEGHTTCTAITTVYKTSVTCLFAEGISHLGFNVQFFFPNTSVEPEMLLVCNKQMSGGLACYKGRQVIFDEKQKIADRFTLSRPPSLNKLNVGYYKCHAVPSLTERSQFCPLTYQDVPRLVPLESLPPPPKDGNDATHVFMLVAVVIMLTLFIIIISAGICLWLKQNGVALWRSRRAAEKERPEDVEDANENILLKGLETRIPEGLAQDYYNMGWRDALEDETIQTTADEPSPAKSVESSTRPPVQHDKRDLHVEGGERRATVDVSQAGRQSSQGVTLRAQPVRDGRGPRSKSAMVPISPQRGQHYPPQHMRWQSSQPTPIAGEKESSEIQPETVPMLEVCQGGSDTSKHGVWDESKEGNTGAGKTSKDKNERGETSDGQESHGGQGGVDSKAKENPKESETRATGRRVWSKPSTWFK